MGKHRITVQQTKEFDGWIRRLRNAATQAIIVRRVKRFELGNPGDVKSVGDGVSELRIHVGPGFRVYFTRRRDTLVILFFGGDESSQPADILKAKRLAAQEGKASVFSVD